MDGGVAPMLLTAGLVLAALAPPNAADDVPVDNNMYSYDVHALDLSQLPVAVACVCVCVCSSVSPSASLSPILPALIHCDLMLQRIRGRPTGAAAQASDALAGAACVGQSEWVVRTPTLLSRLRRTFFALESCSVLAA